MPGSHNVKTQEQGPKNFHRRFESALRNLDPTHANIIFFLTLVIICAGAVLLVKLAANL